MSAGKQLGGLGQVLAIVALCLAAVAVTLSIVALVLASFSREPDGDGEFRLADRNDFTVDFVQQALDRYEEEGRDATIAHYNDPAAAVGEYYVFIFDENAKMVAHIDPDLLGQDLRGSLGLDSHGYRFGDAMLEATGQGIWVDYVYLNPRTGNQEYKHSWVVKRDGMLFGSGWYQILPASPLAASKSSPEEYTVALVDRAIRYYRAHGREAATLHYSSPETVDGPWYVFIFDEDGIRIAHPTRPDLLGKPVDGPTGVDINGFAYGPLFTQTDERGQWVSYVFLDPSTGEPGTKHTWLQRYDGLVFGSGWYE